MTTSIEDINDLDILYNPHLSASNLYPQLSHINFPRFQYIHLNELSLWNNYGLTILTLNMRSIPTNFQSFIDNILCNLNNQCSSLGLTEIRLSSYLAPLYQLPGYYVYLLQKRTGWRCCTICPWILSTNSSRIFKSWLIYRMYWGLSYYNE